MFPFPHNISAAEAMRLGMGPFKEQDLIRLDNEKKKANKNGFKAPWTSEVSDLALFAFSLMDEFPCSRDFVSICRLETTDLCHLPSSLSP